MKYRDIVDKSAVVIHGNLATLDDWYFITLEKRIRMSHQIISEFDNIIITYNKKNDINDCDVKRLRDLYRKYYPDCIFLFDVNNRGWVFGGIDLTKNAYSYVCNNLDVDYVWLLTDDFFIKQPFLDIDFGDEEYDFYGMPFFGYGGIQNIVGKDTPGTMEEHIDKYLEHYTNEFNPQFNFYIIRTDAITFYHMIESGDADERYKKWIQSENPDPREYTLSTEALLGKSLRNNMLNCKMIIDGMDLRNLVKTIISYEQHDGSHKNVYFLDYGLCHMDDINQEVVVLDKDNARLARVKIS